MAVMHDVGHPEEKRNTGRVVEDGHADPGVEWMRDLKRHHLAHQTSASPGDLDRAIPDALDQSNAWRRRHPSDSQQTAA
jgi:hypothetical protein